VGVDVAVTVGVAVAVVVGVAVAVTVGVAVAVAVGVAVGVGVASPSGLSYSSTRLLSLSAIYRLSLKSAAAANGWHRLLALKPPALHRAELKAPPCPKTTSAVSLVSGVLNSSTRWLPVSEMYRSPLESNATPAGKLRLLALNPPSFKVLEVKLAPCPNTRSAPPATQGNEPAHWAIGVLYSTTRLLLWSAT
jgi:hypothetical protein